MEEEPFDAMAPPSSESTPNLSGTESLDDTDLPFGVHMSETGSMEAGVGKTKKRLPAALAGLNLGSKSARPSQYFQGYRDDPAEAEAENSEVVDIAGLEQRSASGRADLEVDLAEETPQKSKWSSRYSVDSHMLGTVGVWNNQATLNQQNERKNSRGMFSSTARTMLSTSLSGQRKTKVFGSGFSFQKKHGNQQEINLAKEWGEVAMDDYQPHPSSPGSKSWEQMMSKSRRRRAFVILGVCGLVMAVLGLLMVSEEHRGSMTSMGKNGKASTFYVTSNAPFDYDAGDILEKQLMSLAGEADMVFHLGNVHDATTSFCPSTSYANAASILAKSPAPVLAVMGAHDWVLCPDQDASYYLWQESFGHFENEFQSGLEVSRSREQQENFGLVSSGVLFVGLHLVTGPVTDTNDYTEMQENNINFLREMVTTHRGDYRALILLGNSPPGPQQEIFFSAVNEMDEISVPTLYIHGNSGSGEIKQYVPFEANQGLTALEVVDGSVNGPLRVTVGFGTLPFIVG